MVLAVRNGFPRQAFLEHRGSLQVPVLLHPDDERSHESSGSVSLEALQVGRRLHHGVHEPRQL